MGAAGKSAADRAKAKRTQADRLLRDAANLEKGAEGERAIAEILAQLPPYYWVLNDLNIPGSSANVDHLVVGPSGPIAIDAKAYGGTLRPGDGTLWRGRVPIRDECSTASWESGEIAKWIGHPVRTVLAFVGTSLPSPVVELGDVTVCSSDALLRLVLGLPSHLTPAEVSGMADRAAVLVRSIEPASRQVLPNVTPSIGRFAALLSKRRAGQPVVRWLPFIGAAAFLLVVLPAITKASSTTKSLSDATVATTVLVPSITPPIATSAPLTSSSDADTLPTLRFDCPVPGAGWVAHMASTVFAADPVGHFVWYQLRDGKWVYWGLFKSGIGTPAAIDNVPPVRAVQLLIKRDFLAPESGAPSTMATMSPLTAC
jgi:hypothetical protein